MAAKRMDRTAAAYLIAGVALLFCLDTLSATAEEPAAPPSAHLSASFEKHVFTLSDGKRMNCHQQTGQGPALVLVPGTWGTIARFASLFEELPAGLPITVVELCWQGGQVPPSLDLSIEELADDVLWVVKTLGIERFYMGGHSIGGMIAVEIAGREIPGLVGVIAMEGWTHHTVVQTAFDGVVSGKLTPEQKALSQASRAQGRAHLSDTELDAIATIWKRWNGYECLSRSQVPVLQIWGDRGKPRPDRKALQIPDRPNIEIAWIAGASHSMLIEAPEKVAEAIAAFIDRTISSDGIK